MTIQSVQNFTTNNFKANSANYDAKSNVMSKMGNFNQVADSFTKSNQVAFKGSFAKKGEDVLEKIGSKIVKKATKGIQKEAEKALPIAEKPFETGAELSREKKEQILKTLKQSGKRIAVNQAVSFGLDEVGAYDAVEKLATHGIDATVTVAHAVGEAASTFGDQLLDAAGDIIEFLSNFF